MTMNLREFSDDRSRRGGGIFTDDSTYEWTQDLDTLALPYLTRDAVTCVPVTPGYAECDGIPAAPPKSYQRPSTRG